MPFDRWCYQFDISVLKEDHKICPLIFDIQIMAMVILWVSPKHESQDLMINHSIQSQTFQCWEFGP